MSSTSLHILVTDHYTTPALARLKSQLACEVRHTEGLRPTQEEMQWADVLMIRSRTKVDENLLEWSQHLKLIITATSGFDHIDLNACQKRNIKACFTPEANAPSAAELTLGLMLTFQRRLYEAQSSVKKRSWRESVPRGAELKDKLVGIIGLGRIGSRVSRMLNAFEARVIAYDPYQEDAQFEQAGAERAGLSEVFRAADILTLHVPLTKETYHLINHQTLLTINPQAILINASRGEVIEETELIEALDLGILTGVALDVFEREPVSNTSRLRDRENVVMTPHVGAYTEEALERASQEAANKVITYFKEPQGLSDQLPIDAPWFEKVISPSS